MIRFDIPDMTCGACARRIARTLSQAGLPAGLQVEIDLQARQVRLPQPGQAGAAPAVRRAIEQAGYTAVPGEAPPAARPRAGGCCCAPRGDVPVDARQAGTQRVAPCCR